MAPLAPYRLLAFAACGLRARATARRFTELLVPWSVGLHPPITARPWVRAPSPARAVSHLAFRVSLVASSLLLYGEVADFSRKLHYALAQSPKNAFPSRTAALVFFRFQRADPAMGPHTHTRINAHGIPLFAFSWGQKSLRPVFASIAFVCERSRVCRVQ